MQDHKRIYRIFQLISRLKTPVGVDKSRVAADFEVSVRTIERYLELLTDIGFELENHSGRYRLVQTRKDIDPHELVVFSAEEAATVRDAMMNTTGASPLRKSVMEKLYALTDMDDITNALFHQHVSRNLSLIRTSIREKKMVKLVDYQSVNSQTISTRTIEPIRFFDYYKYLLAYEPANGEVRQFKVDRIGDVKTTRQKWKHESKHQIADIDIFGMSGDNPKRIVLDMNLRAHRLLIEEFPGAEEHIRQNEDLYRLSVMANGLDAVGRFVCGLLDEISIVEPTELVEHVQQKLKNFQSRHYLS